MFTMGENVYTTESIPTKTLPLEGTSRRRWGGGVSSILTCQPFDCIIKHVAAIRSNNMAAIVVDRS